MNAYLLDTNALLWISFDRSVMRPGTSDLLFQAPLFVSAISAVEIAIKAAIGKLSLPPPFETDFENAFRVLLQRSDIDMLPLDLEAIARLRHLPLHHRDPFDRLIIAQALTSGLTLATRDSAFDAYAGLDILKV